MIHFKKWFPYFLFATTLSFLSSCGGRSGNSDLPTLSLEKKIHAAALQSKKGEFLGPIVIKSRKLGVDEIASHLDMDKETALEYIKTSHIHGYYSLFAKNVPPQGEFTFYHVNLEGKIHPYKTFYAQPNGTLATPLDDLWIDLPNNYLFFANYLPGEPVDFVLVSKEGKTEGAIHIIPNPIELVLDRWHLSVEIISGDKRHYLVRCFGLAPGNTYLLKAQFEQEQQTYLVEADGKGEIIQKIGPNNPKITGGDAAVELRGEGLNRTLMLPFRWGR
jgi:hypothetical protein